MPLQKKAGLRVRTATHETDGMTRLRQRPAAQRPLPELTPGPSGVLI